VIDSLLGFGLLLPRTPPVVRVQITGRRPSAEPSSPPEETDCRSTHKTQDTRHHTTHDTRRSGKTSGGPGTRGRKDLLFHSSKLSSSPVLFGSIVFSGGDTIIIRLLRRERTTTGKNAQFQLRISCEFLNSLKKIRDGRRQRQRGEVEHRGRFLLAFLVSAGAGVVDTAAGSAGSLGKRRKW